VTLVNRTFIAPSLVDDDQHALRPTTMIVQELRVTNSVAQSDRAFEAGLRRNDWSTTCAVPPMWKVRMVSWVPGSPIDWAAMTPTASPRLTGVPRARSRP
jgi:hypothetical protein